MTSVSGGIVKMGKWSPLTEDGLLCGMPATEDTKMKADRSKILFIFEKKKFNLK